MFIDKDSIIINGVNMGQYLVEAKFGYYKIWSSDSGRNLAGTQTGTLIGIFPKLILQFRRLTRDELETSVDNKPSLIEILDSARQTTTYYDPHLKRLNTMTTYTGDYEITNKGILENSSKRILKNEAFSCSFISVRKRG